MHSVLNSYDRLCTLGRDAIYWGLKCFEPWLDKCVWVPSFHCGVEVQAALDAGFDVDFYRINSDLSIDEEDLIHKFAKRPGPIMIIHYYGFAQPGVSRIADLCNRKGALLIEDCSHALFSTFKGQPLGNFGHFAAFSLYKTLGLCDGGALSINRERLPNTIGKLPVGPSRGRPSLYGYRLQLRSLVKNILGPRMARRFRAIQAKDDASINATMDSTDEPECHPLLEQSHDYRGGMSLLSLRLASTMDPVIIKQRRNDNWQFLHNRLSSYRGYSNLFPVLEEGVCPLYLPIRVIHRDLISSQLNEQNIETFVFGRYAHPRMNKSLYPEAKALREEILCLPLHQYMDEPQLERLEESVGPLIERYAL